MYSYVRDELRETVINELPVDGGRLGIFGHSMGGHGALMLALRNPDIYRSVSAFAPIAAPTRCPWGEKAFSGYLGADREAWKQYDASELVGKATRKFAEGILVDQGMADQFLTQQLNPDVFDAACKAAGQPLTVRRHEGYDHGYFFISTFIEDHLAHHAKVLLG
jgi:S-formylglutathione hydrolase